MSRQPPSQPAIPTLVLGGALLITNRLLLAARLRNRRDGWRNAAGLVLRGEESTFILSAFGLDPWAHTTRPEAPITEQSQAHISVRLAAFLAKQRDCCIHINQSSDIDIPRPCQAPTYTLTFAPWREGPARFIPPSSWGNTARGATGTPAPLMNVVARLSPAGACDLWLRINHVGADGVPMQELLNRLESEWEPASPVTYPTPDAFAPHALPRPSPGRDGLAQLQFFADFAPLVAWRKRQNARLQEPITLTAALLWAISRIPEFRDLHLGTTVEVAASGNLGRGVGVVVVRPNDHARHPDALARYVRAFNRQMDQNRRRASEGCKTLDAAALIPPTLARPLLRHALTSNPRAFGTLALTMLKDAAVFGTPIAEAGHADGFIAVGSVSLPCDDRRPGGVGCVTVKGRAEKIANYPRLIAHAITSCAADN